LKNNKKNSKRLHNYGRTSYDDLKASVTYKVNHLLQVFSHAIFIQLCSNWVFDWRRVARSLCDSWASDGTASAIQRYRAVRRCPELTRDKKRKLLHSHKDRGLQCCGFVGVRRKKGRSSGGASLDCQSRQLATSARL